MPLIEQNPAFYFSLMHHQREREREREGAKKLDNVVSYVNVMIIYAASQISPAPYLT